MDNMKCIDCEHFLGGGDWNLCCSEKYGLCYANTDACELFSHVKEDKDISIYINKYPGYCPWCHMRVSSLVCPYCNHRMEIV